MAVEQSSWSKAKEIFQDARELTPRSRARFVEASCDGDDALRASVAALLDAESSAGAFLSSPTQGGEGTNRLSAMDVFAQLQQAVAGRYSLEREAGRGGMGIVFLARDVALDRPVAIKLLPPELSAIEEHRERFLREARTAARLSHPNIVPIHLVEERAGLVYFVMAYVDGESLSQRVQRAGPLKAPDAAKMVQEVAWALAYAHGNGVIHRDIKPDNVLIEKGSGRALVTDFGIARVATAGTLSLNGEVMGTLRYMSPEQALGQPDIDGRSDLYSLGVTAFFALTGALPFEDKGPLNLLATHASQPAPPVRSVNPAVPAALAEAIDRCLVVDPDGRWETGGALAAAIESARVTRKEIAPSVREFLGTARNFVAHSAVLVMIWWGLAEAIPRMIPRGNLIGHPFDPIFAVLMSFTTIALILPLRAARRVVRAGLDEHDVAEAVAAGQARDANVEYERKRLERIVPILEHPLTRTGLFGFFVVMEFYLPEIALQPWARTGRFSGSGVATALLLPGFLASMALILGLILRPRQVVALTTRGTPENSSMLRRLWSGPVGRWLFKVAGIGLKRPKAGATSSGSAPTEVLLGRAAGAIFDQLPRDQQRRLGDVHEVIRGLEQTVMTLRTRHEELSRVAADIGNARDSTNRAALLADVESARQPLEERMRTAVSALETLRIDLLRLRAGVGQPDDLTVAVDQARSVRDAVEIERAAISDVNRAMR